MTRGEIHRGGRAGEGMRRDGGGEGGESLRLSSGRVP
jgi:hypothetical protein